MVSAAVPLCIVAAVGRNGAIGVRGAMPWSIPSDLRHFRSVTLGKPMIMGRRTFAAIGRVLPGRETILVTRATERPGPEGVWIAGSAEDALDIGAARAAAMGADEIILAGGATLFASLMPMATRMRLTFVDLAPDADTFFPPIDPGVWREDARGAGVREAGDEAAFSLVDYSRRA